MPRNKELKISGELELDMGMEQSISPTTSSNPLLSKIGLLFTSHHHRTDMSGTSTATNGDPRFVVI
jgi:hypothetical protein